MFIASYFEKKFELNPMCLKELSMAFLVFPVFNPILFANSVNPDAYSWVDNSSIVFGLPLDRDEIAGFLKALLITSKSVRTIARIIFKGNRPSDNNIFGRVPSRTAYIWFDLDLQIEWMKKSASNFAMLNIRDQRYPFVLSKNFLVYQGETKK